MSKIRVARCWSCALPRLYGEWRCRSKCATFRPGDNGTLGNFTISNGLCDYNFNIPVTCIGNCAPPTTNILTQCQCQNSFQISITITDLGGSSALSLVPSQGAAIAVSAPGEYILGPFPNGTIVNVKSLNAADPGCNVNLGNFSKLRYAQL